MGLTDDITKIMRTGPELAGKLNSVKFNTKSIARGVKDATFQFPCLAPDSAPFDMINTCVRTLDQTYATFTQTWLSMNSMFDITIDPTPMDYLRRLHQNFKLESKLEIPENEIEHYMEKVYDGTYRLYMNPEKTYGILFNVAECATSEMMKNYKDQISNFLSEFDLNPIECIQEADNEYNFAQSVLNGTISKSTDDRRRANLQDTDKVQIPKLLDRDIKKLNDLVPYGIQVRLLAVNDKKEFVQYVDFIVGVKTVLHLVQSQDMVENIARALQNKSVFFKFLRWTTGELSLVKDIILNVNSMKQDAFNRANGKSPFFSTLNRLRSKKIGVSNLTVPHAIIPNATIIITAYEVDQLQTNYGLDITNPIIARKLLNSLFLMTFVIMDEGAGTLSVLYDGSSDFQLYSLETLERDNSLNSNKLGREIGRMISH